MNDGREKTYPPWWPKVTAVATDTAHVPQIQSAHLPCCEREVRAMLGVWAKRITVGFVIVMVPLNESAAIKVFYADGPKSLRRQAIRAARSLHGERCAWVRGLEREDDAIVCGALNEICARVSVREEMAGCA